MHSERCCRVIGRKKGAAARVTAAVPSKLVLLYAGALTEGRTWPCLRLRFGSRSPWLGFHGNVRGHIKGQGGGIAVPRIPRVEREYPAQVPS
jgi:hypothetical protein